MDTIARFAGSNHQTRALPGIKYDVATAAAGRRRRAEEQEGLWARERRAHNLSVKQGFNFHRRGFAKID